MIGRIWGNPDLLRRGSRGQRPPEVSGGEVNGESKR